MTQGQGWGGGMRGGGRPDKQHATPAPGRGHRETELSRPLSMWQRPPRKREIQREGERGRGGNACRSGKRR